MMLEIGVWGLGPGKIFGMLPNETLENALSQGEIDVLVFIIRNHTEKEKLVLLNFQDLELKKKILRA